MRRGVGSAWMLLSTPARVAVAIILLAGLLTLRWAWKAAQPLLASTMPAVLDNEDQGRRAEQYALTLAGWTGQVDGRSMFFTPAAPPPPPPPPSNDDHKEPPPPPPPSTYGGPSIVAILNDAVWFSDGTKRGVSDEEASGLKVLEISPPWEVKVRWSGQEFTVPVFARDSTVIVPPPPEPKVGETPGKPSDESASGEAPEGGAKASEEPKAEEPAPSAPPAGEPVETPPPAPTPPAEGPR